MDRSLSTEERRAAAASFLAANPCCIDEHFFERLRGLIADVDDLFLLPVQRFLAAVLRAALASTSHSENAFAHMRQMLQKCMRPPHISTVAAHHCLLEIMRIHRMWLKLRESAADVVRDRSHISARDVPRERPGRGVKRVIWSASKKTCKQSKLSTYNAFVREHLPEQRYLHPCQRLEPKTAYRKRLLALCGSSWAGLNKSGRARFDGAAAAERCRRRLCIDPSKAFLLDALTLPDVDAASFPWGLADQEFPFSEREFRSAQASWYDVGAEDRPAVGGSFMCGSSKLWSDEHGDVVEGDGKLPEKL